MFGNMIFLFQVSSHHRSAPQLKASPISSSLQILTDVASMQQRHLTSLSVYNQNILTYDVLTNKYLNMPAIKPWFNATERGR